MVLHDGYHGGSNYAFLTPRVARWSEVHGVASNAKGFGMEYDIPSVANTQRRKVFPIWVWFLLFRPVM